MLGIIVPFSKGNDIPQCVGYCLLFGEKQSRASCRITFNSSHAFSIYLINNPLTFGNQVCIKQKTMKKFLFTLVMSLVYVSVFAQKEVQLKAGTIIPLRATNTVAAADVKAGDKVLFTVARDINIDGVTAIPYGTSVSGVITLAKRSSWWGTKGRLSFNVTEMVMPNGTVIPLQNGMVQIQGKNRTTLSVVLFALVVWPACFICGSKAEMQAGYEIQVNVAANTALKVE